MPEMYDQFAAIAARLERHYREMQDMEFTIERGKLWMLQTRDGKRTAQAAVRIAVDLADEGLITPRRGRDAGQARPGGLLPPSAVLDRVAGGAPVQLAKGLNVSPGAAVGIAAFDADLAERWAKVDGKPIIMVRPETKPDDVHGMLAAQGILTSRGGRTSHAALVARQFGKPAVVGVAELDIDMAARTMTVAGRTVTEGDWISIDGTSGEVYLGQPGDGGARHLRPLADRSCSSGPTSSAPCGCGPTPTTRWTPSGPAATGRRASASCRTEHMFFETERLPLVQKMIMATRPDGAGRGSGRAAALPARRLRGPVPGHGRPAGDHPAHRPAAARVPAVVRTT